MTSAGDRGVGEATKKGVEVIDGLKLLSCFSFLFVGSCDASAGPATETTVLKSQSSLSTTSAEPAGADGEMHEVFSFVFNRNSSAVVQLPQRTQFGPTGKMLPFSVAPIAISKFDGGAVLMTAAESPNASIGIDPGSDMNYVGVHYVRPRNSGLELIASYPTALTFIGGSTPTLSREFTDQPVLVASTGFTHMGHSRYWTKLYELRGGAPVKVAEVATECSEYDRRSDKDIETSGEIVDVRQNRGFSVVYDGDRKGRVAWTYRKGQYVPLSRHPDICDWEAE